jgi:hypothetical protein
MTELAAAYSKLANELLDDVQDNYLRVEADNRASDRRNYVRSVFAMLEGVTHLRKQIALEREATGQIELTAAERALILEEQYDLNDKGEVRISSKYPRLPQNMRFSYELTRRAISKAPELDTSGEGWMALKNAIRIRHRITHPKSPEDLVVTDDDLATMGCLSEWHANGYAQYL